MLAKLPEKYIIAGDEVTPYLVLFNSHDGSSGVKVAMTPVRVVCQKDVYKRQSSEGVDLLELAAFVEGGDEDAQFTDGEQESPAKGRFRQPSVCQMEEEMLEKTDFLYRKSVLYHYNCLLYTSHSFSHQPPEGSDA